jgi:hypothetical protein
VLASLDGVVSVVSCTVMKDTMVNSAAGNAFVFMEVLVTVLTDHVLVLLAGWERSAHNLAR